MESKSEDAKGKGSFKERRKEKKKWEEKREKRISIKRTDKGAI